MRRSSILLSLLALGAGCAFLALRPLATGATVPAFGLRSAALAQHGRNLVWTVSFERDFTPAQLTREDRSLCLQIDLRPQRLVNAELCLRPAERPGRPARLQLLPAPGAHGRHARLIRATVRDRGAQLQAIFRPQAFGSGYGPLDWQVASDLSPQRCQATLTTTTTSGAAVPATSTTSTVSGPPSASAPGAAGAVLTTSTSVAVTTTTSPVLCASVLPEHPIALRLHTPRLVGCKPAGPSLVFSGPSRGRQIALSFDDGPWNDPPSLEFVKLLARYHVPGTFFEIGDQISTYDPHGTIERRMLAAGDMIGDHTWTHPDMTRLTEAQQRSQLQSTADAIRNASGFMPCLWRPPYGAITPQLVALARSLGLLSIYWNIDPRDWSLPGVGAIEQNVLANARAGGIVEMHFGGGPRTQTLAALPGIIDGLRARGFHFVSISQMLGLRMIYR